MINLQIKEVRNMEQDHRSVNTKPISLEAGTYSRILADQVIGTFERGNRDEKALALISLIEAIVFRRHYAWF